MGGTIGVGVLAGYLAITPSFPASPLIYLIFLGSSSWIAGFDMIYVIPDRIYDLKNGLKTVVTQYGVQKQRTERQRHHKQENRSSCKLMQTKYIFPMLGRGENLFILPFSISLRHGNARKR